MHPKVLIIGTVPFNVQSSSRAFDSYFHFWEKENLAQIFSNPKKPCKGHCGTLFQITDHEMLDSWKFLHPDVGTIYNYDNLDDTWENNSYEVSDYLKKFYKFGAKRSPLTHLLRGILWRKKFWCTKKLNDWLDSFHPDCVFLAFSNDYFINKIAIYVSKRYNIPIVSCIGDDYYFNKRWSFNPLYYIYMHTYKSLIRRVFKIGGSAVYICDKIRDKYNKEFNLDGQTVYLNSTIERKHFSPINKDHPIITYFGNVRIGRNNSLCDIADVLSKINSNYRLEVYSNEQDETYTKILKNHPFIKFGGSISYEKVKKRMRESDITIIVEGFLKKDIDVSRYSLSTKAADALACGSAILVYGSIECGIIEYMKKTEAAAVCTSKSELLSCIFNIIEKPELQKKYYSKAIEITHQNHTLESSCAIFEKIVTTAIANKKEV